MGGGGALRIQSVKIDRGPNVVNGYKTVHQKFGNSVLQFLTSTMKQQSLFAYLMHVSQGSQIYILKLFFCLSHFASTTEACWDQTFPHRECSRPSFATPSSGPKSSSLHTLSEKFCQFHEVSRSSPVCSVSVLCHSVHIHSPLIKRAHFSPTLYTGLFHPSLATSVRSVRRYTKHGLSKLPFSVYLRISTVAIYYYIYVIWPIVCYKNPQQ